MEIALIAAETKKELMVQFCIAYCGVLAKHNICATKMTGKIVSEATGLDIEQLLPGNQGGMRSGLPGKRAVKRRGAGDGRQQEAGRRGHGPAL